MALRKPLVIVNGQVQQIQTGDFIQSYDVSNKINDETTALLFGNSVYTDASGTVKKAKANDPILKDVIGIVLNGSVAPGAVATIMHSGPAVATTTQWDAIFGTTGGLTPRTRYFLSDATAGDGSSSAPTADGSYVVELGIASSTTELVLSSPFRSVLL